MRQKLKVAGSLNVGFVLIALNYVISWVLALVYVRVANANFDPMVERAAGDLVPDSLRTTCALGIG